MTKPFIAPDWSGETVAVVASGSSAVHAIAQLVGMKIIAVRRAVRLVPDADAVLALDAPPNYGFWDEVESFGGIKLCGCEVDGLDAMYVGSRHELVTLAPGHQVAIRNNGLAAIRVAEATGTRKIVLAGFDGPPYSHFYGEADPEVNGYPGLAEGLAALIAELRERGVDVEVVAGDV